MAKAKGPKPSEFLTASSFRNAQVVLQADRRLDQRADPSHRDPAPHQAQGRPRRLRQARPRGMPVLVDLKPSGDHYMEHFHHAGGVPKLMKQLGDLIDLDAKTITGATLREVVAAREKKCRGQDAIRASQIRSSRRRRSPGVSLWTNARRPGGRVIKHSAASPKLLQHTGPRRRIRVCRGHDQPGR